MIGSFVLISTNHGPAFPFKFHLSSFKTSAAKRQQFCKQWSEKQNWWNEVFALHNKVIFWKSSEIIKIKCGGQYEKLVFSFGAPLMKCVHQIICPTLWSILMDYFTIVYLVGSCPMYDLMNILHWKRLTWNHPAILDLVWKMPSANFD